MNISTDSLRSLFSQPYDTDAWQDFLYSFFGADNLKSKPVHLDTSTEEEDGFFLGTSQLQITTASVFSSSTYRGPPFSVVALASATCFASTFETTMMLRWQCSATRRERPGAFPS